MLNVTHFRGREDVLANAQRLGTLAAASGQTGALSLLEHLLSVPYFKDKMPTLVLLADNNCDTYGGAFVLEYRVFGISSHVFVPVDSDGELTVVALPQHRRDVARRVADYLLSNGAAAVLLTLSMVQCFPVPEDDEWNLTARRSRELRRTLVLQATVEATLSTIGVRSRRNLRHFSRRAEAELGAVFLANAELSETEFVAFACNCLYTVPEWVSRWRYNSVRKMRGGFISGLRARDGSWLSLIGGHRYSSISTIDWQMNRRDIPSYSIGTAMRMFQLKEEIVSGMEHLRFEGGTPHSIQSSFLQEQVDDLLWTRGPGFAALLWWICRLMRKQNLFTTMLASEFSMQRFRGNISSHKG